VQGNYRNDYRYFGNCIRRIVTEQYEKSSGPSLEAAMARQVNAKAIVLRSGHLSL